MSDPRQPTTPRGAAGTPASASASAAASAAGAAAVAEGATGQVGESGQSVLGAQLPAVVHDYPAAVLLIDTAAGQVVFVNDLARQLAPDLRLPVAVEDWSRAAGLEVTSGDQLGDSSTPLAALAAGDPQSGRQVSAALRSEATKAREALWAIGMPLRGAPQPLRARSLLVLLPLRFPDAVAGAQAAAASGRAHQSVLASGLAMAISEATHEIGGQAVATHETGGQAVATQETGGQAVATQETGGQAVATQETGGQATHEGAGQAREDNPLVWVSRSFEQLTGYTSEEVLGRNCRFLQGPDTDPEAVTRLREGLAVGRETVSVTLLNYRHDGSAFYNHVVISPVTDEHGQVTHYVSVQSDVTGQVLAAQERAAARAETERARLELAAAQEAETFGQLLLAMSEALTATSTLAEVAATITEVLAPQLGASSGGLLLADAARTRLDFVSTAAMPADLDPSWSQIGWEEDAPIAAAVRTRQTVFYPSAQALRAAHPAVAEHAELPTMGASINLPLVVGGPGAGPGGSEVVGGIVLIWDAAHDLPAQQRAALEALARYAAQAVQRATLLAERRSAAQILQQSLLTRLPEPNHLELRARYVPAATGEYVGGDWYDAIVLPDGATTLVIGDVTGHDMAAAAHMGQLRGLLRAFAYDHEEPPTEVVSRLDRALAGLGVEGLATLVLARIEQSAADADAYDGQGLRRLVWTNAGHPPPVLLLADGTARVLDSAPEMLVGLLPETERSNHTADLPPGSTLLLFTDGLIEHRGRSIDDGVADLRRVLSACGDCTLEELLDHVVTELVGASPEDDCAILAVRAHREDRPRPPEAGPRRVP